MRFSGNLWSLIIFKKTGIFFNILGSATFAFSNNSSAEVIVVGLEAEFLLGQALWALPAALEWSTPVLCGLWLQGVHSLSLQMPLWALQPGAICPQPSTKLLAI